MDLLHYGLQRSGTNFLETLLKTNYRVRFLNIVDDRNSPLHKHCRLYSSREMIPESQYENKIGIETFNQFQELLKVKPDYILIVSKDPYSWYLSYKNWAQKCHWPNVDHHYIEEYNLFYRLFMNISSQSDTFIFIKYIDLIRDPSTSLRDLEEKMNLKKNLLSRLTLRQPDKVPQSSVFSERKRTYYLNQEYLNELKTEEMQTLNQLLDHRIVSFLGYKLHDSVKQTQAFKS